MGSNHEVTEFNAGTTGVVDWKGHPLNPYLRGHIVAMLLQKLKLKELRLVLLDLFTGEDEE